jgi:pimeloyl-ACP methyl ester carboxylesterase
MTSSCRPWRGTAVGRHWIRRLRRRFRPLLTPWRASWTDWACRRCTLPVTPSARSLVLFSPAGAWRSQRSIELRAAGIRLSVGALGRYASRADAIAANALLRWPLLAGQVAHPGRVPPEELAAYIRAGALAPVVVPLLREIPLRQVQPLPADRDYPVRLVWADRDRVLPFAGFGAAMLERIPGAELIRLRDVGHVPMSDDPARVAELILQVTTAVDRASALTERADRDA